MCFICKYKYSCDTLIHEVIMIIYPILTIWLLACSTKQNNAKQFTKKDTNNLKGLFALLIFFHHISYKYNAFSNMPVLSLILNDMGSIGVGVFFFISGYGLLISNNNPDYAKNLLTRKIPKLYLLHITVNFLYIFTNILRGISYNFITFITTILGIDAVNNFVRANSNAWYISSIIIIYFLFAIVRLLCKKYNMGEKTFFILFSLLSIITFGTFLFVFSNQFEKVSLYIRAIYCLFFGMFYYYNFNTINAFMSRFFWYIIAFTTIFIILLIDIQMPLGESQILFTIIKEFLLPILVVTFIITINQKIGLSSSILNFLGNISLEIFLLHGLIQDLLFGIISNQFLYTLTSLLIVIILSFLVNKIYLRLTKNCQ